MEVDVDEVYIGGRPRYRGKGKRGRGTEKTPVLGMVQRDGEVRFRMMDQITADRVGEMVAENADLTCRIITHELGVYRKIDEYFPAPGLVAARATCGFFASLRMTGFVLGAAIPCPDTWTWDPES